MAIVFIIRRIADADNLRCAKNIRRVVVCYISLISITSADESRKILEYNISLQ